MRQLLLGGLEKICKSTAQEEAWATKEEATESGRDPL